MTDGSFQVWKESGGGDLSKSAQSHPGGTDLLESIEPRAAEAAWVNLGIFVQRKYNIRALDKFQSQRYLLYIAERTSYHLSQKQELVLASDGSWAPPSNDHSKAARRNSWIYNLGDDLRLGICRALIV